MNRFAYRCLFCCLFAPLCLPALLPKITAAEDNKAGAIAFMPFEIHAGKDMNYLKDGVRDMLASRLAAHTGLEVVDKMQTDSAFQSAGGQRSLPEVRSLGTKLGADYLVTGSITDLGAALSIDTKVIRTSGDGPAQSFYVTAATPDQVIPAVDQLALDINGRIFAPPAPPTTKPHAEIQREDPNSAPLETAHPDRAFIPTVPMPARLSLP